MKWLCAILLSMAVMIMGLDEAKSQELPNLVTKGLAFGSSKSLPGKKPVKDSVKILVLNNGKGDAGEHLTLIEIHKVNAGANDTPISQYTAEVPQIGAGESFIIGPIKFADFSPSQGTKKINTLTAIKIVVIVDAKNVVKESNENDNVYYETVKRD